MVRRFPRYALFHKEKEPFWLLAGLVSTARDSDYSLARLLIREAIEEPE